MTRDWQRESSSDHQPTVQKILDRYNAEERELLLERIHPDTFNCPSNDGCVFIEGRSFGH
jgi:hypothetical protein